MTSTSSQPNNLKRGTEHLLEYEDYLVICCPKCFGFPSATSICCRPQLSATPSNRTSAPPAGSSEWTEEERQQQAHSESEQSGSAGSSGSMSVPSSESGASSQTAPSDAQLLSSSTQSSRDLALLSCSLPPRRGTKFTTMHEEINDFEYDEGNRFIRDKDL